MRIAEMPACHVIDLYICQRDITLAASNAAAQESRHITSETACDQRLEFTILSHRRIVIRLAHMTCLSAWLVLRQDCEAHAECMFQLIRRIAHESIITDHYSTGKGLCTRLGEH